MKQRVIYVYTHDSIGLGEDGPTHQPIEQLPGLRMMPGLSLWRPCDTVETSVAWRMAIERHGPTCLLFSRQNLAFQERDASTLALIQRGGYVLRDSAGKQPDVILIATGSEVTIAMEASVRLLADGFNARVVSMPSVDVFLAQSESYQKEVLPDAVLARVAVEAAASAGWYQFVGLEGCVVGIDRFGASAPAKDVYQDCGITVEHVVAAAKRVMHAGSGAGQSTQAKYASNKM
jgi:transketolase